MVAGCEAATLEYLVDDVEHRHDGDESADEIGAFRNAGDEGGKLVCPAEQEVHGNAHTKPDDEVPAGIGTVAYDAVDQLGDTVDDTAGRYDGAELGLGNFRIDLLQQGYGKGEVLTHEVEHGVAYHRADDDSPLPVLEAVLGLFYLGHN